MAKEKMHSQLVGEVSSIVRRNYDAVMAINVSATYKDVTYKHALLPIWTASYDYNGKKYRYIINGETGKVSGTSPISAIKVAILLILIFIIGMIVLALSGAFSSDTAAYINIIILS